MRASMRTIAIFGAAMLAASAAVKAEETTAAANGMVRPVALQNPHTGAAEEGIEHGVRLAEIAAWIVAEFDLPPMRAAPSIRFASSKRMAGLRYRDATASRVATDQSEIVAVYDDEARTIFLPEGWSGKTPAEMSVLVHELVHHLQNEAGQKFGCPENREQLAYEAQERWLARTGGDLMTDFGVDPFTLLVRTNCLY